MNKFDQLFSTFSKDNNEKGAEFEKLAARFFFLNSPYWKQEVKKVHNYLDWDGRWADKDLGTDLILEMNNGEVFAVQCKGYSSHVGIDKPAIDSFLADSNRKSIDGRVLIASTNLLNDNAKITMRGQEKPITQILLDDLREWDGWPVAVSDLRKKRKVVNKALKLRDYQKEAVKAVTTTLSITNKTRMYLACRLGKTLVSYSIDKEMDNLVTVYAVPNQALVAQSMRDWLSYDDNNFHVMAVASDQSLTKEVDENGMSVANDLIPYPSTTDVAVIKKFVKENQGNKVVIFTTYHSLETVANAGVNADLFVADEAHMTTGDIDKMYSFCHSDKLKAKKRLFMTATPRIYGVNVKNAAKNVEKTIVSMDNEEIYGPLAYEKNFGSAISDGYLAPYQIVVVGVTRSDIMDKIRNKTWIEPKDGVKTSMDNLCAAVATDTARKKYNMTKSFVFANSNKKARDFRDLLNLVNNDKYPVASVDGGMPYFKRNEVIANTILNKTGGVVSNCRCVGVGVNVPSLDGVVMIDAKSSVVDIIQTVARPLTIDPNNPNKIATILIPVFVDDAMEIDEMIEASSFKNMVNVINAMKSVDETLIDAINDFSTSDGSAKSLNAFSKGRIKFDIKLPEKVSTEEIMSGVRLQVLRSTQNNTESMITRVLTELVPFVKKEKRMPLRQESDLIYKAGVFARENKHLLCVFTVLDGLDGWTWEMRGDKVISKVMSLYEFVKTHQRMPTQSDGKDLCDTSAFVRGVPSRFSSIPFDSLDGWDWSIRSNIDYQSRVEELYNYIRTNNGMPEADTQLYRTLCMIRNDPKTWNIKRFEALSGWKGRLSKSEKLQEVYRFIKTNKRIPMAKDGRQLLRTYAEIRDSKALIKEYGFSKLKGWEIVIGRWK